jgi:hypothetical protein
MITGLQLLEIALYFAAVGGIIYWVFVALPRENARRREELMARRAAHQAWSPSDRDR